MAHIYDPACTCKGCELLKAGHEATIDELIERSSLGTPEAKAIRARTPDTVASAIVDLSMSPAPGYHRLRPTWARRWRARIALRLAEALAWASKAVGQ